MVNHITLYSTEGCNLDCAHPAQLVLDALCGDNKDAYAQQLQDWFDAYSTKRGTKNKGFKTIESCVPQLL